MTDQPTFTNMVKSLHNLDWSDLPELDRDQWLYLRLDPARYFMRASDEHQDAIFREVMKRQRAQKAPA